MHAFKGYLAFRAKLYPLLANKYKSLKLGQKPKTLFITCSDSRVLPNQITNTGPGELFVIRNAGNFITPKKDLLGADSTVATIEYAVTVINVDEIVICGHTHCGAIDACLHQDIDEKTELGKYLNVFHPLKKQFQEQEIQTLKEAIVKNVQMQMQNLMSYAFVREKVNAGALQLSGWFYDFETAELAIISLDDENSGASYAG